MTDALTYAQLRSAAGAVAARVAGASRVAVWATNSLETCVAVVGALAAGVPIVPINPKAGTRELEHILGDCAPEVVLGRDEPVDLSASGAWPPAEVGRRGARDHRLHVRDDRAAEGRGAAAAGDRGRTSTRSPRRGTGRATTWSRTGCRSSTCTG